MLQLFADTDSDITPQVAAQYGFKIISMPYSYDGKTYYPYEDYDVFEPKPFYDLLRGGLLPTTSAVSEHKYTEYFEPVFKAGNDIFYVHFSSAMSMTFGPMRTVVDALLEKYPERKFYSVDTKAVTILAYNIVCEVGDMYKAGADVETMIKWVETERSKFAMYLFADDLKFFMRSGRVSGLAGTMGTLLGVRPIINMNDEGKMLSIGKERGREKAIERLVSYVETLGDDIKSHRIVIGHSDAFDIAARLEEVLKEKFGDDLNIISYAVNPTLGSHCGPSSVGVSFHAVHR